MEDNNEIVTQETRIEPAVKPSSKTVSAALAPLTKKTLTVNGKPLVIQPTTPKEVEKKIEKKLTKNKKPITVDTILSQKKSSTLEKLLIKDENESMDMFLMRSQYSRIAAQVFPKYPVATFVLLGRIGANRGYYGSEYPEDLKLVIDYIDEVIKSL